jgi:hypothetical protein
MMQKQIFEVIRFQIDSEHRINGWCKWNVMRFSEIKFHILMTSSKFSAAICETVLKRSAEVKSSPQKSNHLPPDVDEKHSRTKLSASHTSRANQNQTSLSKRHKNSISFTTRAELFGSIKLTGI